MITKERLEELFKKDAPIYRVENNKVCSTKPKKYWSIDEDRIYWTGYKGIYIKFNELFETKEDAEEYAEFGNITRTDKLPYVSWEKFKNKEGNYSFKVYPYDYYCYTDGRYVRIKQYYGSLDRIVFTKPLTRENYNEARRICVKLFKGENDS